MAGPRSGALREQASNLEWPSPPWRRPSVTPRYPQPTGAGTASKWEQCSAGGPGGTPGPTWTLSVRDRGWSGLGQEAWPESWVPKGWLILSRRLCAGSEAWGPRPPALRHWEKGLNLLEPGVLQPPAGAWELGGRARAAAIFLQLGGAGKGHCDSRILCSGPCQVRQVCRVPAGTPSGHGSAAAEGERRVSPELS